MAFILGIYWKYGFEVSMWKRIFEYYGSTCVTVNNYVHNHLLNSNIEELIMSTWVYAIAEIVNC
jgi:uncharacterized protein YqhQ